MSQEWEQVKYEANTPELDESQDKILRASYFSSITDY